MGVFSKLKENKDKKNLKLTEFNKDNEKYGSQIRSTKTSYLGGHIDFNCGIPIHGTIDIYEKGIVFVPSVKSYKFVGFSIPFQDIINVEYKNEKDIEKDVTMTRLFLLGIYAFGAKKKKVENHDYLILTCNQNGIENKIIFEASLATVLVTDILKARRDSGIISSNTITDKQDNIQDNILEKIKKLGELKDLGVLTEEEFSKKKTELLAKV
ncbi:SHOCT domain-containing protein [Clostridium botulinum]|uniref:SHOCT domain-containing protein n=1 Tax=Clostridium botulinum TaxID=1491 RepID=UPI0004D00B11|nr:SHOCT domain-containing protein [Clostridium botulinum]AXG97820.1 SHOCT domain-containing protein [Clostridium botulinum]MBY6773630.1 SHOCT domain-containing protein [Clostridium botulinum]MBY6886050.1 SHOCT domain-containing protein [Clostridium botulinum]